MGEGAVNEVVGEAGVGKYGEERGGEERRGGSWS